MERWWTSGERSRHPRFNPWQTEQNANIEEELDDDLTRLHEQATLQETEWEEDILGSLRLDAQVAARAKRFDVAIDSDSDSDSEVNESDIATFMSDC